MRYVKLDTAGCAVGLNTANADTPEDHVQPTTENSWSMSIPMYGYGSDFRAYALVTIGLLRRPPKSSLQPGKGRSRS